MTSKTVSILSYCTFIGWLIAYFGGKSQHDTNSKYHLKQGFGLFVISLCYGIATNIISSISLRIGGFMSLVSFIFLAIMILGIINATNDTKKPLPIIGKWIEGKFNFIN
ncbi:DUF4870 domain-containing protein [Capnocytophaga sp. ARDL2]|uniref:DUF4870 domain-containing protein n=1 Tax=Capnocytophaga sp. ARDL2 TaxID=3238809 RepID=UPI0035567DCC